jgi:hypothetical protein
MFRLRPQRTILIAMTHRTASCSCSQLQAHVTGEPVRVSVCHCLACQRRTGSAFAVQARFPKAAVSITGTASQFVRVGDEGGRATFHFCPRCGDTVYYAPGAEEEFVAIPVGAFADPRFPAPTISVYEERRHAWVHIAGDLTHID